MRVIFDSNAFDKMKDSDVLERIISSKTNELFITSQQVEEIGNIPDCKKEKRIQLLMILCKMRARLLYVPAVFDKGRFDCSVFTEEDDVYYDLLNQTHSNQSDAMIGSTAKRENCIIVTDDIDFAKRLKKHDIQTITFEEFVDTL